MCAQYIFKKSIDKSVLTDGFSIPARMQTQFLSDLKLAFGYRGAKKHIKFLIDGEEYEAVIKNQPINNPKNYNHVDVLQVRYSVGSALTKKLRAIFSDIWDYIVEAQATRTTTQRIRVPEELNGYIALYATPVEDVIMMEYITPEELKTEQTELGDYTEERFELESNYSQHDPTAAIKEAVKKVKLRQMDHNICNTLKELYDYRCQVTEERIGDKYSALVVEAHHIDYFTRSLNNDTDNIVIISPTFHRIIHKENPTFDRNKLQFVFPNGVVEPIRLNKHLSIVQKSGEIVDAKIQ